MNKLNQPKLILLLGPAGCGKTQFCTEAFEESLKESNDPLKDHLLFILPTAEHRARTIDLILRKGLGGFFQRRITTFDRALKEFLKLGGVDFATDVTRRIILKEILGRLELQYFNDAQKTNGFLDLIAHTVIELKEYLIRPEDLQKKLAVLKKEFPDFSEKYDDLAQIYEAYEQELKSRNLTDQRDSLRLLEEGLSRGEFESPNLAHVWIDGFSDFSKLQLSFIEFLTRHADEITITLTLDQDPLRASLFELLSQTRAALEDIGFKTKWMEEKNHRAQTDELRHLEKNLFRANSSLQGRGQSKIEAEITEKSSPHSIRIFEATGLAGEMEMIAREIKKLIRGNQYHFSDIALLFRTTDPYIQVIQSIFRKFEIPFEIHERFRLRTTPIARTLSSFFEIFLNGWNRKDLFNFLKSSYVKFPSSKNKVSAFEYQAICDLELAALQKGIFKDRNYWLKSFPESEELKMISVFEDEFLKLKNVNQFTKWVKNVLISFGLLEFPKRSDEKTHFDRQSVRRILLLLDELIQKHQNAKSEKITALAEEFLSLMEVDLFSIHGRDKNKVQIYNVSLARQKEYKAVFVAGLLEKQFPILIKEDPVLSDSERRALNQKGEVLKERLPRQTFERYLFYLALTRASEHLILSYPRFNLEGKEALPSFYVDEVKDLFPYELPVKQQHITDVLPDWNDIGTFAEAEALTVWDLWQIPFEKQKEEEHSLTFSIYNHLIQDPEFQALIERLRQPIEGVIYDDRIRLQFKKDVWSPTWLEEYAECPFRYFADRLLKLESQIEGIDIKRRGTILHDVLEHFFTFKRDSKKEISFDEAKQYCLNQFEELWNKEPLTGDRFYKIELERKRMEQMIIQILRLELIDQKPPIPGLDPAYFEFEFSDVILKGNRRDINLRGKIDRIDIDPKKKFALVIDYKSGKPFHKNSLDKGTSLQLPFYLIAVREKLGLKPLGGHLYSLKYAASTGFHHHENLVDAGVSTRKGVSLSGSEFESLIQNSVQFAEKFVEGIEKGEIPVRPRDCVPYCSYSTICRIEKWRLEHIYREIAEEDKQQPLPSEIL